jgi:hypothetical protein
MGRKSRIIEKNMQFCSREVFPLDTLDYGFPESASRLRKQQTTGIIKKELVGNRERSRDPSSPDGNRQSRHDGGAERKIPSRVACRVLALGQRGLGTWSWEGRLREVGFS